MSDMTWDEAETIMRQLEKELRAASNAHTALRLAREADVSVRNLEADIAKLTKERNVLQQALSQEKVQAATDRGERDAARAASASRHAEALEQNRKELADLEATIAVSRKAVQAADVERARIAASIAGEAKVRQLAADQAYAAALDAQRSDIAALEAERQRVAMLLKELKAKVSALA